MRHHARPIQVALVGCGRIAQSHLEVIESLGDCRLSAVVDVHRDAAATIAARTGAAVHEDYQAVLEGPPPDAVVICTPPNTHAEVATFFLKASVHVLCEKPLAVTVGDARAMVDAARGGDAVLMMASKFRYVADIVTAKNVIESGLLGEIVLYENAFCGRTDMRNRWNSCREISGGGVLIDNGCHSVDIARYLLGPIAAVQVQDGKNVQGLDVEDTVQMYFRTASGVIGSVDLSWSIPKERDTYINVYGTAGMLSIGWRWARFRQDEKLDWVTFGHGYRKHEAMSGQMRNFLDAINGVDRPLITELDALESVRVIEAAYRSLAVNKWLGVEEPARAFA
jgi:predicted dehydrogenase